MTVAATYAGAPPSNTSSSNVAAFANTTFSFASGTLYVLCNVFDDVEATAEVPNSVVLSGATPPTVTRVTAATATFNTVATSLHRQTVYWWIGDGVSRTITVTMPDAGTGNIMYVAAVTGADNTSPIVQGAGNQGDAGVTPTCTLAAFGDAVNNGALVFAAHDTTNLITAEGGGAWTELNAGTDLSHTTPNSRISAAFRTGQDTSPSMTIAANSDWGCVAVEIKAALDASVTPAVVARSITAPQADPQAGSSVTPATFAAPVGLAQTSPSAGVSMTPATIAPSVGVPALGTETDTTVQVAQALETDEATVLTWSRVVHLTEATETDEAQPISIPIAVMVGMASETDTAFDVDGFLGAAGTGIVRSPNRVRIYSTHNEVT